jgi:hypothetical protein
MTVKFSDHDKGQYLNAAALAQLDPPVRVTIESVTEEEVRDPKSGQLVTKLVVRFKELDEKQGLILNKTNNRKLRTKFGDDVEAAIGKPVILAIEDTPMGAGIRLRFPEGKPRKVNVDKFASENGGTANASANPDPDDDLNDFVPV